MSEYTQGVCHDGAAILKDGIPLTIEQILQELRQGNARVLEAVKREARQWKDVAENWEANAGAWSEDWHELKAQRDPLAVFVNEAINACFDGGSLDGAWIQERGEELGLLEAVEYDPAVHHIDCDITEPGDTIYVRAAWLGTKSEEKQA